MTLAAHGRMIFASIKNLADGKAENSQGRNTHAAMINDTCHSTFSSIVAKVNTLFLCVVRIMMSHFLGPLCTPFLALITAHSLHHSSPCQRVTKMTSGQSLATFVTLVTLLTFCVLCILVVIRKFDSALLLRKRINWITWSDKN